MAVRQNTNPFIHPAGNSKHGYYDNLHGCHDNPSLVTQLTASGDRHDTQVVRFLVMSNFEFLLT